MKRRALATAPPLVEPTTEPERRLWHAVLIRALHDLRPRVAEEHRADARDFFGGECLTLVCAVAGLDPEPIRGAALRVSHGEPLEAPR